MLFYGCAQQAATIYGGDKDEDAPVLIKETSFINETLNFAQEEINLFFDEYIVIKNPVKEVSVSPPLTYIPQVKSRGKKLIFKFDPKEVLRDSTTYSIDFGVAVTDLNEGNKLEDLKLVFSTGNYIDSLAVSGTVKDYLEKDLDKQTIIAFYLDHQDSVVAKQKPYYFAKVEKNGSYEIRNMKAGDYKVVGFIDRNINRMYDAKSEGVGFIDSLVTIQPDSFDLTVDLSISGPVVPLRVLSDNDATYGKVAIKLSEVPARKPELTIDDPEIQIFRKDIADSLNVYYDTELDSFSLFVLGDTIKVQVPDTSKRIRSNRLVVKSDLKAFAPRDSFVIGLSTIVQTLTSDSLKLTDTAGLEIAYTHKVIDNKLAIFADWQDSTIYNLEGQDGFITDIFGNRSDSLSVQFTTGSNKQLGSLQIVVTNTDSTYNHLLQISLGGKLLEEYDLLGSDSMAVLIPNLTLKEYDITLIEDRNNNKTWDPALYWEGQRPERISSVVASSMIANGVLEVAITYPEITPQVTRTLKTRPSKQPLQKVLKEKLDGKDKKPSPPGSRGRG